MNVNQTLRHFMGCERLAKFTHRQAQLFNGDQSLKFPRNPYFIDYCGKDFHTCMRCAKRRVGRARAVTSEISLRHLAVE